MLIIGGLFLAVIVLATIFARSESRSPCEFGLIGPEDFTHSRLLNLALPYYIPSLCPRLLPTQTPRKGNVITSLARHDEYHLILDYEKGNLSITHDDIEETQHWNRETGEIRSRVDSRKSDSCVIQLVECNEVDIRDLMKSLGFPNFA